MLPLLFLLCNTAPIHLEGDVAEAGGDYVVVPFDVPAGMVEVQVAHSDGSPEVILDWGVWQPDGGFRGWGGGLGDDAIIGVDESSRGYLEGPIPAGTWSLVIGKAKLAQGAGRYVVDVTCRPTATLTPTARAGYTPTVLATGPRWYRGDFHVHSEESGDASASLDQIATLARSRGLDFVAVSDHNTVSHLPRLAAAQPGQPALLFLRAAEVTTYAGHGNALGLSQYVDHRVGFDRGGAAGPVSATTLVGEVVAQGALFVVNHPALRVGDICIGCGWTHADTPWDQVAAIEIQTGPYELTANLFTPQAIALWDEQLAAGHRLAAVGGSDDHRAGAGTGATESPIGSPTTMVYADDLSEASLLAAVRAGRTIVQLRGPDDPVLDVTARGRDGLLARLGDDVIAAGPLELAVHLTGAAGGTVSIWRDGDEDLVVPVPSDDWTDTVLVPAVESDVPQRIRVEVNLDGQRVVVSGHFFVRWDLRPGDGCGCQGSAGAGGLSTLLLATWFAARRRRARRR